MYIGTESEARKRFQENRSISRQHSQSRDRRQWSFSKNRYDPRSGYDNRSCYDKYRSSGRKEELDRRDRLQSTQRLPYSPRCIGCKCDSCTKNAKTLNRIEDILKKDRMLKQSQLKNQQLLTFVRNQKKTKILQSTILKHIKEGR